ncbi:hypothetical protein GY45DRAFT_1369261 [Cubamyces sp. BRFM 1775]|nr:hypothetical protein GY45DRAFT_1369261 [Cubamyces sp. BRFM 1775]
MASRTAGRLGANLAPPLDPKAAWPIDGKTWLVLKDDTVSANFPAGTLVLITAHRALPESRSASPERQETRTKVNTVYSFKTSRVTRERIAASTSGDAPILSSLLSSTRGGRPKHDAVFKQGQLVYLIGKIPPFRVEGHVIEIPENTVGKILKPAVSRAGAGKELQSAHRHPTAQRFQVEFAFQVTRHETIVSGAERPSDCFRLATAAELKAYDQNIRQNPEGVSVLSKYEA